MKKLLVIASLLIAVPCATTIVAQSENLVSQISQGESKVKNKHGKSVVRDKSKPVRKALEDWQRFPDGTLHKVEGIALQRETWRKTAEGWKLYRVDNIRDGGLFVDHKPYKPNP